MLEVVDGNAMANVSFWPTTQNSSTPHYLCDSDITSTVTSDDVLGLAFVFYASDPVVAQLNGMANTFQVSSFFDTCKMIVTHDQTGQDDAIAEKFRGLQEVISLSFPRHLQMAQDVFGNSVGVGF